MTILIKNINCKDQINMIEDINKIIHIKHLSLNNNINVLLFIKNLLLKTTNSIT